MTTVYIAGPMTGYPDWNHDAFNFAEAHLTRLGYKALNPARHGTGDTWGNYMRRDLLDVLNADGIYLLPGWEASRGATLEVHVAHALAVPAIPQDQWNENTLL